MKKRISVWIKRPGDQPRRRVIRNKLEDLQEEVGGYIETVTLTHDLVIICNEEGHFLNLEENCMIGGNLFVGPIIIAGIEGDEFADCPLDSVSVRKLFPDMFGG